MLVMDISCVFNSGAASVVYILNTLLNRTVMLQLVHIADKLILQSEGKSGPTLEWFLIPV